MMSNLARLRFRKSKIFGYGNQIKKSFSTFFILGVWVFPRFQVSNLFCNAMQMNMGASGSERGVLRNWGRIIWNETAQLKVTLPYQHSGVLAFRSVAYSYFGVRKKRILRNSPSTHRDVFGILNCMLTVDVAVHHLVTTSTTKS